MIPKESHPQHLPALCTSSDSAVTVVAVVSPKKCRDVWQHQGVSGAPGEAPQGRLAGEDGGGVNEW